MLNSGKLKRRSGKKSLLLPRERGGTLRLKEGARFPENIIFLLLLYSALESGVDGKPWKVEEEWKLWSLLLVKLALKVAAALGK